MKLLTVAGAVCLLLCAAGGRVEAQGVASSFDQLGVLVQPGDKITVVDVTGKATQGRIGMLSRERLTLVTPAGPRELKESDVAQIRQRRGDPLRNGAIIGAVSGTAYCAAMVALLADSDGGDILIAGAIQGMVTCAGLGAAVGVGIDALISSRYLIYSKTGGASRVGLSPLFGRGRRGAAITLTF